MFDWVYSLFGETSGCNASRKPETKRPTVSKVITNKKPETITSPAVTTSQFINNEEVAIDILFRSIEELINVYGENYLAEENTKIFENNNEFVVEYAKCLALSCNNTMVKEKYKSTWSKYPKIVLSMKPVFDELRKTNSALVDYLTSSA
jgi:hypothetical protein